jgi:hypothetical protein
VHIILGITITPKTRNATKTINKVGNGITSTNSFNDFSSSREPFEPDGRLWKEDLSVYFYHWIGRIPQWRVTGKAVLGLKDLDFSLHKIWLQSYSRILFDIDINRLKKGEIFKFDIEYSINQNIPPKWKIYFISLCPVCKKAVNIHFRRPVRYCPNCAKESKTDKQQLRRAIKQNRRLCKTCSKPLPRKYPNRNYCPGGACKQKSYRNRKQHGSWLKNLDTEVIF